MRSCDLFFWNWQNNITLLDKSAPCDDTKDELEYILKNEIEPIENLTTEETNDDCI